MHFLKNESKIIKGTTIEGSCLLFKIRGNEIRKGLLTAKGQEIWPEDGYFGSYNCGLCQIEKESGYGYINRQGEMVIEPKYLIADDFSENRAWVSIGDNNILIDNKGIEIKNWGNDYLLDYFSESVARIIKLGPGVINYNTGYINIEGELIIPFMEEFPLVSVEDLDDKDEYCSDGLIRYKVKYKYGYIDKNLDVVIPFQYKKALKFLNGFARVFKEDDWGFINKDNEFFSLAEFESAGPFYNGQAIVFDDEKSMAINSNREIIREFDVDFISDHINGHYIIGRDDKVGVMDHDFNEIFPPVFDQIEKFEEGILHYLNEGKSGVCNLKGEYIEVSKQ